MISQPISGDMKLAELWNKLFATSWAATTVAGVLGLCMLHMAFLNALAINGSKFMDSATATKLRAYCAMLDLIGAYELGISTREASKDNIYLVPFALFLQLLALPMRSLPFFRLSKEGFVRTPSVHVATAALVKSANAELLLELKERRAATISIAHVEIHVPVRVANVVRRIHLSSDLLQQ